LNYWEEVGGDMNLGKWTDKSLFQTLLMQNLEQA